MAKKEGIERRDMTLREIRSKLRHEHSDSPTKDEIWDMNPRRLDQIDYLEKILKRKALLTPETRQNVYRALDKLYAQEARSLKWGYIRSGLSPSQSYKLDHASEYIDRMGELAEDREDYSRAVKLYTRALKLNEKAERRGSGSWSPVHTKEEIDALKKRVSHTSTLEQSSAAVAIIAIALGTFFLSSNITGNAISNLTTKMNYFGLGLIILATIIGLFYIYKRNFAKKSSNKKK